MQLVTAKVTAASADTASCAATLVRKIEFSKVLDNLPISDKFFRLTNMAGHGLFLLTVGCLEGAVGDRIEIAEPVM